MSLVGITSTATRHAAGPGMPPGFSTGETLSPGVAWFLATHEQKGASLMEVILPVLVLAALVVLSAQGWLLFHQMQHHKASIHRLNDLTQRVTTRVAATVPPGDPAPPFELPSITGTMTSLSRLLAAGKPLLLFFTDPRCSPCYALLPDIGGWQRVYGDRLSIALVSGGAPEANRAMTAEYGIAPGTVLLQQGEHEVADAYGVNMMPSAVVIRPDGRRSGEVVYGTQALRQLVADTLGLALPDAPDHQVDKLRVGDRVPALIRPDLDGQAVSLGEARGESTLLLFWSPGCSHCQDLLTDMKAWEQDPSVPNMLIVSRGPIELNRAAELRSTIVLDDDGAVGARFGMQGTPAGVVIDALGMVASDVVAGTTGVRALVAERFALAATAAD